MAVKEVKKGLRGAPRRKKGEEVKHEEVAMVVAPPSVKEETVTIPKSIKSTAWTKDE